MIPQITLALLLPLVSLLDAPKPKPKPRTESEPTVVGIWVLKSATIDGRAATPKDGLLKYHGGTRVGALYKFRSQGSSVFNGVPTGYTYMPETKEIYFEGHDEKGVEIGLILDVRFVGSDMKLSFEEKGRKVELQFKRE